ncbi:MAG: SDR family NAD(P)-dependent oxidoreductase [Actinomycetia bacterium]|nr:SDR family NAD(P)-dependent oxidoreductase [Actinomycetes bacterium]
MSTTWTGADVPGQSGRVAVITGANTGIGYEAAEVLAGKGAHVVLAVRNPDKGKQAVSRIKEAHPGARASVQQLDLTSLASVRAAADVLHGLYPQIDLLINNAGVMTTPKASTEDGFELQFGTNHLGHFALTGLLLDNMLAVQGSRVVTISSNAHRGGTINFGDLQSERSYNRMRAYGQAKLANLMFTYELDRRLLARGAQTIAVAAHPGSSNTELARNLPRFVRKPFDFLWSLVAQDPTMGALPTLRAATDPAVKGGQYYGPDGFGEQRGHPTLVQSSDKARDIEVQQRLWSVSEKLTGVRFVV